MARDFHRLPDGCLVPLRGLINVDQVTKDSGDAECPWCIRLHYAQDIDPDPNEEKLVMCNKRGPLERLRVDLMRLAGLA